LTFGFSQYTTLARVADAVAGLQLQGGETNYAQAFRTANAQLFSQRRPDVKTICIMITDGQPNFEVLNTFTEISVTKAAGIEIFAIGVTKNVSITATANVKHVFFSRDDEHYYCSLFFRLLCRAFKTHLLTTAVIILSITILRMRRKTKY